MNIVNIANKIAADIDPNDTILVTAIKATPNIKQINPIFQFIINNIPKLVATPFPPLNPKNTGNVCPITTSMAAICANNAAFLLLIFAINIAKSTATTPFNISQTQVNAAAFFPILLNIFVLPAFPLPFSLISNPAIFLLINIEKFTLPIK